MALARIADPCDLDLVAASGHVLVIHTRRVLHIAEADRAAQGMAVHA